MVTSDCQLNEQLYAFAFLIINDLNKGVHMGKLTAATAPAEVLDHLSSFFDTRAKVLAGAVCRHWRNSIPPVQRLFIIGSPVLVQTKEREWHTPLATEIEQSFAKIPEDGFIVFPSAEDAYLYAHNAFHRPQDNPNYNDGIAGSGVVQQSFLVSRSNRYDSTLYHPVVFEVAFDNKKRIETQWHPFNFMNLGGESRTILIGQIKNTNCKKNLTILSARLAIESIGPQKLPEPVILHDSKAEKDPGRNIKIEEQKSQKGQCIFM